MSFSYSLSSLPYYRSPLAKNTVLTWNMHATQDIDYHVSVVKDILNSNNPALARTCTSARRTNISNAATVSLLTSSGEIAVLDTLAELSRRNIALDALVLENDYRDGILERAQYDINKLSK
ncbi:hypothetical protein [Xenorhabdus sp. TH1]|uniref:hypothetical protein n=1 Tax=Xenorhabdus sp. TH1 TaxID=3130166 RepID=UPI0030CBC8C6